MTTCIAFSAMKWLPPRAPRPQRSSSALPAGAARLGKDINVHSVACVTAAILTVYRDMENEPALQEALGISTFAESARTRLRDRV